MYHDSPHNGYATGGDTTIARPEDWQDPQYTSKHSLKLHVYSALPHRDQLSQHSPVSSTSSGSHGLLSDSTVSLEHSKPSSTSASVSGHDQYPATARAASQTSLRARIEATSRHRWDTLQSEASRQRGLSRDGPPISYTNRISSEGRQTPPDHRIDNFSRPRKTSVKSVDSDVTKPTLQSSNTFPLSRGRPDLARTEDNSNPNYSRNHSGASTISVPQSQASLRTTNSIPNYTTPASVHSKERNMATNSLFRPGRGLASETISHNTSNLDFPPHRSNILHNCEEEPRTSFRSTLTTGSSFAAKSATEGSSIFTKNSSIISTHEGMSVDDAIGMYEAGFQDSSTDDAHISRPETACSHRSQDQTLTIHDGSSSLPLHAAAPLPAQRQPNRLIRDSDQIFIEPYRGSMADDEDDELTPTAFGHDHRLKSPTKSPLASSAHDIIATDVPLRRRNAGRPDTGTMLDPSRDEYGFKKASQYVSIAEYDAWYTNYSAYLARRRKKWLALCKHTPLAHSRGVPLSFPPRSTKMKRFIRKGVPAVWRGAVWFHYSNCAELMAKHPGHYDELLKKAAAGELQEHESEQIERDLHRTFPDNIRFKPDRANLSESTARSSHMTLSPAVETDILLSLRRVLQAFAIHAPKIGYCQSLNFLAGLLLLFLDEEEKCFWLLVKITHELLPGTHSVNLEGANVDLGVLMTSIKETMPPIWAKIGGELDGTFPALSTSTRLPPITLCCTAWFMSIFIGTLPIETTLRVWDTIFYEGSKSIFRIALTIFKLGESEIRAVQDPMEIFQVVQSIPRRMLDANLVLETCFGGKGMGQRGVRCPSMEQIEARRAERRALYAEERRRAAVVAGVDIGQQKGVVMQRKGTMFRRRKKAVVRQEERVSKEW